MSAVRSIVAEFETHERLVETLRRLREEGYSRLEVYTPFPSDEIDALLPGPETPIGWLVLGGGICGGCGAYFMEWYASHDYLYNVGGRPVHSWPSFIPVTFELTVLTAALVGFFSLLCLTRLPRLHHTMFAIPQFQRASRDRFFIAIRTDDPRFVMSGLDKLLRETRPLSIVEVEE